MEKQPSSDCTRDNPTVLVHCGVFAPAAPRRAWTPVSVSISGLPLSWPVPVTGLVSSYLANCLIGRSPILGHATNMVAVHLSVEPFQASTPIGY